MQTFKNKAVHLTDGPEMLRKVTKTPTDPPKVSNVPERTDRVPLVLARRGTGGRVLC